MDKWKEENEAIRELVPFASVIPQELVDEYVWALTHTYIGYVGYSHSFARTNFYADEAAIYIPKMFELFDDRAAESFLRTIRESQMLRDRLTNAAKMARLRSLAVITLGRVSNSFTDKPALEALCDPAREDEAMKALLGKG